MALKLVIYLAPTVAYTWQPTHSVLQASELHTACSFASHREMSGKYTYFQKTFVSILHTLLLLERHIFQKQVC